MRSRSFRLLLIAAGALAACFTGATDDDRATSEDELRFRATSIDTTLPDVDAIGYEIDLAVTDSPGHESFQAVVKGTYVATKELAELVLDFDGNAIDTVTVGGKAAEHARDGQRLVVKLPRPVASGRQFTTRIAYHGVVTQADGANPNDLAAFGGFMVKQRNAENQRIYTSLSWPSKARRWLPLRDHPRDAAQVAINATFPKAFTVLANGKRLGRQDNADGSATWRYEALTPMPTYAFHVAAYEGWKLDESRSASNIPIATYTYADTHAHAPSVYGDLPKVLDYYEATFGTYRWGSATFIEEPIFGGGMEHASVVSMDESLFHDTAQARSTAFHELAHHWSGNLVHFRTWNDFWLSEGFTEYLAARARTKVDGAEAGKRVWREYQSRALAADRANPHALAPAGDELDVLTIFDSIPYKKGALVLRMLEHIVGEATMTAFLRGWFDRHGFGAAVTTDDLQRELEDASGRDLSGFFATIVREGYHPELRVSFTPTGDETTITIAQVQSKGPGGGFLFPIDLDLIDEAGHAERVKVDLTAKTTTTRWRTPRPVQSIVVDPDEHTIAVATCGQVGEVGGCGGGFRCVFEPAGAGACVPR